MEDQTVGAVEADNPSGQADVEVDSGVDSEVAEMLPGTDHAPWKMRQTRFKATVPQIAYITWVYIYKDR